MCPFASCVLLRSLVTVDHIYDEMIKLGEKNDASSNSEPVNSDVGI
jgi:hypothetical protein